MMGGITRRNFTFGFTPKQRAWKDAMAGLPGLFIPIRIVSEANQRDVWGRIARAKAQKEAVVLHLVRTRRPMHAVRVKLTIYTLNRFDDDNRAISVKAVRDAIAKWLGVDDKKDGMYIVEQEKSPRGCYGIRIEFLPWD